MTDFAYSPMFPTGTDSTEYELVTADHVEVVELGGEQFLKVGPEGLRLLAAGGDGARLRGAHYRSAVG